MKRDERKVLVFVRLVLLLLVILTAAIALILRGRIDAQPASVQLLEYAFMGQAVFAIIVMLMLRRMVVQPRHAQARVPLTIVGWAVGESVSLLGGIVVMMGGDLTYLVVGLFIFYISSRIHPLPD